MRISVPKATMKWPTWVTDMVADPSYYEAYLQDLISGPNRQFTWLPGHDWILMESGNGDFVIDARLSEYLGGIERGDAFSALLGFFYSTNPNNRTRNPKGIEQIRCALKAWGFEEHRELFQTAEGLSAETHSALMLFFDIQRNLVVGDKFKIGADDDLKVHRNMFPILDRAMLRYAAAGGQSPLDWDMATFRENDSLARALQWAATGKIEQERVPTPILDRYIAKAISWRLKRSGKLLQWLVYSYRCGALLMRAVKRMPKGS